MVVRGLRGADLHLHGQVPDRIPRAALFPVWRRVCVASGEGESFRLSTVPRFCSASCPSLRGKRRGTVGWCAVQCSTARLGPFFTRGMVSTAGAWAPSTGLQCSLVRVGFGSWWWSSRLLEERSCVLIRRSNHRGIQSMTNVE